MPLSEYVTFSSLSEGAFAVSFIVESVLEPVVSVVEDELDWLLHAEKKTSVAIVKKIPGFMV